MRKKYLGLALLLIIVTSLIVTGLHFFLPLGQQEIEANAIQQAKEFMDNPPTQVLSQRVTYQEARTRIGDKSYDSTDPNKTVWLVELHGPATFYGPPPPNGENKGITTDRTFEIIDVHGNVFEWGALSPQQNLNINGQK